ncbi:MAG: helix-turn-helix domain-containing protein [Cyclobacteriaceae bacterium]
MKEKNSRKLAAIMFTDIVGYTALMQRNEQAAARARSRHREVFQKQHSLHQGEIVQYYGDGTLSVFDSAIKAVTCAIEIQKLLQEGDSVQLRIGLHLGDIVFNETEVYGDGVNFASRIESLGTAGSILLSEKVNDEIKNHATILTTSLGHFKLKNIIKPVEVFAISNKGIKVPLPTDLKGKQKTAFKNIAVLPFVNMSSNVENEYFSDGITEEIINALAKIDGLKVISRTSSFYFKGQNASLSEIAEKLKVSTLLEGSVRMDGDTLRIKAQLIDVHEDETFWSETWERKKDNLFKIQDELSLLIADKLREHGGHLEISDHLVDSPTKSLSAYEHLLKGRFYMNKWNPEDTHFAIDQFDKAIAIDPALIEAHLSLADSYSFMAVAGFAPREESWMKAVEAIQSAKDLDSNNAGLNYMLGNQAFFTEADFASAMKYGLKSLASKPTFAEAHCFVSFLHTLRGDLIKAKEHIFFAKSIDPLNQETQFFEANYCYRAQEYAKANLILDELLKVNDKNLPAIIVGIYIQIKQNRLEEALRLINEVPMEAFTPDERLGLLGLIDALNGDVDSSHIKELAQHAQAKEAHHAHSYLFIIYAVLGRNDDAFNVLEKLFDTQSSILLLGFSDPLAASLQSDPRYMAYHDRIYPDIKESSDKKTKPRIIDDKTARAQVEKLTTLIESERPYLNPAVSLRSLADQADMHPNQLSLLLNEYVGKNFNEFINSARVEYFKKLIVDPDNAHISLIGLAYESGFNSKTVFNNTFKKEVGMTPKEFQKSQQS